MSLELNVDDATLANAVVSEKLLNEIEPKCEHFAICGGCSYQHLTTDDQLSLKQNELIKTLGYGSQELDNVLMPPIEANSWNYRRRFRLSAKYDRKKDRVLVGFREKRNPRFVADINKCHVISKRISNLITPLKKLIYSLSIPNKIPQIEGSEADNGIILNIRILEDLTDEDIAKLCSFMNQHNITIYLQRGNESTIAPLATSHVLDMHYNIPSSNIKIEFKSHHFTQVNFEINQLMLNKASELLNLTKDDVVLDLFCGIGNLGLSLDLKCKQVIGVELSNEMIEQAKHNASINNITNCSFFAADLFTDNPLPPLEHPITQVIIDPARPGAGAILPTILSLNPKNILYISCNPVSFASDCAIIIASKQYYLDKLGIVDMFPQTKHCESIALFKRREHE